MAVLSALRIRHAVVLGLSAGGGVAIEAVLLRPDLFDGLVVVGSVLGGYAFSPAFLSREERNAEPAMRGDYAGVATNWIADPYTMPSADDQARSWYRALRLAPENLRAYRPAGLRPPDPLDPPAIGRLQEIRARTLIVLGERDHPDVARIAQLLARGIPGSRLIRIPRAGHLVPLEQPEQFGRALEAFLGHPPHGLAR